jgi:hypothetical protein
MALNKIENHPSGSASPDRSNVDPTPTRPFPGSRATHAIATAAVLAKAWPSAGRAVTSGSMIPALILISIPTLVGFVLGWGLRSLLSHNRREKARRYRQVPDPELEQ